MSLAAWILRVNGTKSYEKVEASEVTSTMKRNYKPRFFQVYDEDGDYVETEVLDFKTINQSWLEEHSYTMKACSHRVGSGKRGSFFTTGPQGGTGEMKNWTLKSGVPAALRKSVKDFFVAWKNGEDIQACVISCVGAIDSCNLEKQDLEEFYSRLWDYTSKLYTTDGEGNAIFLTSKFSHEDKENCFQDFFELILDKTNIGIKTL